MEDTDREDFALIMAGMSITYERELTDPLIAIYWRVLCRFDLTAVQRAADALIATHRFKMPKPADFVKFIEGTSDDRAVVAWTKVYHTVRDHGGGATVVFDDRIVHAIIGDLGGWIQFCGMREDEEPFRRREFEARYAAYLRRPPVAFPRKLLGRTEAHNSKNGFREHIPRPILIGEHADCMAVLDGGVDSYNAITNAADASALLGRFNDNQGSA